MAPADHVKAFGAARVRDAGRALRDRGAETGRVKGQVERWRRARALEPALRVEKRRARPVARTADDAPAVAPRAMRQHAVRRALSCAAREADFDEHRADARNFGCVGHDGREYYPYAP